MKPTPVATPWRHRGAHAGFTLVEVLVVVVIVAILATAAVLSIGTLGRDSGLKQETDRLVALLGVVQEQAEMQNRDYGLRLEETRYGFARYDVRRREWVEAPDDRMLRTRELPPGLRMRLYLEAREAVLRPPARNEKPRPPQVLLLANGDLTDFELRLEREQSDHSATIRGRPNGEIEVRNVDDGEKEG